jgi:hypothetical protein
VKEPAVNANVPAFDPDGMTRLAGVPSGLWLVSVILAPPVGAAFDRVAVQVLDAFGPRMPGAQATDETWTGATRMTVLFTEVPL